MSNIDVIIMAFRNLLKRKMRTMLTIVSVVIGATAIVIMISLGIGINQSFDEQMKAYGDMTIINIYNYEGYYGQTQDAAVLDDNAIDALSAIKGVEVATPVVNYYGLRIVSGRQIVDAQIYGVKPEAMSKLGFSCEVGEFPDESDGIQIAFSADLAYTFRKNSGRQSNNSYGYRSSGGGMYIESGMGDMGGMVEEEREMMVDPMTDRFKASYDSNYGNAKTGTEDAAVKKADVYNLSVTGVLLRNDKYESGSYCFMDINDIIKISTDRDKYYNALWGGRNTQQTYGYEQGIVKCTDYTQVEKVLEEVKAMGFTNAYSPMEWINNTRKTAESLQLLLLAIGAVSLFIAAIGIANTMIMATYERTREIGIMKVIGAAVGDIRRLFLLEAALIGFIGGTLGIGLSFIVSYVINKFGISFIESMSYNPGAATSIIPIWLALAGLGISAIIGLVSGFMPARRATRISALTAIRTE